MSPPLWQFWTDWTIKALGTLATFLVVLVALLGSRFRHWIAPPRLTIVVANAEGWSAKLYTLDPQTRKATSETSGIWYHVRVDNQTRWNPVTGVHIFLLSVEAPDASGEFKLISDASSPLSWRNEPNPQPKTIGYHAECDLCYIIIKEPREVRLSPLILGQVPRTYLKIA